MYYFSSIVLVINGCSFPALGTDGWFQRDMLHFCMISAFMSDDVIPGSCIIKLPSSVTGSSFHSGDVEVLPPTLTFTCQGPLAVGNRI